MKAVLALLCSPLLAVALVSNTPAFAQDASATDKAFLGKAAQSELYALAASKYALDQADSTDVKDLAWIEARDHERILKELKTISAAKHSPIASALDQESKDRFDRLKASSGRDFDIAFLKDMAVLHNKEEELFAQEAATSPDAEYKAFAAKTEPILKHHIDALADAAPRN